MLLEPWDKGFYPGLRKPRNPKRDAFMENGKQNDLGPPHKENLKASSFSRKNRCVAWGSI